MKVFFSIVLIAGMFFQTLLPLMAEEIPVKTKIARVMLFRHGAEITREGQVVLMPGRHFLILQPLASDIREESIRVSGTGAFTILSVKKRLDYLAALEGNPEWKKLQHRLEVLEGERDQLSVKHQVIKGQIAMLEKNQQVAGNSGLDINKLAGALSYYEKRMTELVSQQMKVSKAIQAKEKEIAKVKKQMEQFTEMQKKAAGEIVVTVDVKTKGTAKMRVSYYTPSAGWRPSYDVRVDNLQGGVKLLYKALVSQNTGEAWKGIPLVLSTGDPWKGGNLPELHPWILDFVRPVYYRSAGFAGKGAKSATFTKEEMAPAALAPVTQRSSLTTTQYELRLPFTIYPEKNEQTIVIRDLSLPAKYAYHVIPKLSPAAYLTASVTGWKDYELLSGPMNLFLEGAFVGTAYLDASRPVDTLVLTLGRDDRIKVTREKIGDMSRKKKLGGNIVEIRAWKITVMNGKQVPVHLFVEDQIPLSRQKEIVVTPEELSGARLDPLTGRCVWEMELQPGEKRSVILRFSVKYPKEKEITL